MKDKIRQSRILIVDDNAANIALLENILEVEGFDDITSTTDPCSVVSLCVNGNYDLLLLDIRMPRMSGLDIMRELVPRITPENYFPIIVLTAQLDEETRRQALSLGAKDFLTKPFELWEAVLRIENQLETQYLLRQEYRRSILLEQKVAERTREIHAVQLEIVRRLGLAGEFRDNETGAHVVRMSRISEVLARGAGLDETTCSLILHASAMHDVGKIGIPDHILLKEGKLTAAEWKIMQEHTKIGQRIIGSYPSPLIEMASSIARSHHEKWDGSGYPDGLCQREIPVAARIAAISDVFDALLSARPYKKPWPLEKALALLRSNAGSHFDPELIEVFFDYCDDILAIRRQCPDPTVDNTNELSIDSAGCHREEGGAGKENLPCAL